ncbi:MAG: phage tail assembly chaperone [Henriciella sp.]|nr:phage tail assembly chaperone [Henriciella sp.]
MLPWAEMFRAAVSRGLSPEAFWQLSVREWLWLSALRDPSFDADDLLFLMETHPDG